MTWSPCVVGQWRRYDGGLSGAFESMRQTATAATAPLYLFAIKNNLSQGS